MQLLVAAVGTRMPDWVQQAWDTYARRFPRGISLSLREIPLARRGGNTTAQSLCAVECRALAAVVPDGFRQVVMDRRGRQWSTTDLARQLEAWMREERGVCFLVGGPDGLNEDIRKRAHQQWSLSRLTFPHAMVRVILAEQLYRAWSITQNHPYHRE